MLKSLIFIRSTFLQSNPCLLREGAFLFKFCYFNAYLFFLDKQRYIAKTRVISDKTIEMLPVEKLWPYSNPASPTPSYFRDLCRNNVTGKSIQYCRQIPPRLRTVPEKRVLYLLMSPHFYLSWWFPLSGQPRTLPKHLMQTTTLFTILPLKADILSTNFLSSFSSQNLHFIFPSKVFGFDRFPSICFCPFRCLFD